MNPTLRLFVDANTIVSGLLFDGDESELLWLGFLRVSDLVTVEYVMEEVKQSLRSQKFDLSMDERVFLVARAYHCLRVYPNPSLAEVARRRGRLSDEKDLPVLAGYEQLGCRFIVTGDKEILKKVKGAIRTHSALRAIAGDLQGSAD